MLGLHGDNGKENGNYYIILGFSWENGKENGNYCITLGFYLENGKENGNYCIILGGATQLLAQDDGANTEPARSSSPVFGLDCI